jgi:hypothetical protein
MLSSCCISVAYPNEHLLYCSLNFSSVFLSFSLVLYAHVTHLWSYQKAQCSTRISTMFKLLSIYCNIFYKVYAFLWNPIFVKILLNFFVNLNFFIENLLIFNNNF